MTGAEAQAAATIAALSNESQNRVAAARMIKNAVVGNPTNKRLYLRMGAFSPLVSAAADVSRNPTLAEQAVAALGSLATLLAPDAVASVVPVFLAALFSPDPRPVNAAARALKMLVMSESTEMDLLGPNIATSSVASRLVMLLSGSDEGIAEVCAVILSRTSVGYAQANVYEQAGAIPALVLLLCRTNHERCIEACLNAMSALARQDRGIAQTLVRPHSIIALVLPFTRSQIHSLRLSACRLLTIFHSAAQLPSGLDGVVTTALVGLLNTDDISSQIATAHTLAELVLSSEDLQRVATEADAIEKLADVVKELPSVDDPMEAETSASPLGDDGESRDVQLVPPTSAEKDALRAAALTAMAALCSNFDDAREKLVSLQVLQHIVDALSSGQAAVVLASIKCIRSLSRSVKIVRRDIAREKIGRILLDLLEAENTETRRIASATLCNLVLEFSPIRTVVLEKKGISVLVSLLKSDDEELRKNALWALKNVLFKADSEAKTAVMAKLGYENLLMLCSDRHPRVRELAMTVVRNLACSGSTQCEKKQLDALLWAAGNQLIGLLSDALRTDVENSEIAVQALYVVCNIASGTEEHKGCLMDSDIPQLILRWTSHENEKARIAAVWCAINLSWKERPAESGRPTRILKRTPRSIGRGQHNRLEILRRQHLPLPSSAAARRELERSDPGNRTALNTGGEYRSEGPLHISLESDGPQQEPQRVSNADGIAQDTVMSTSGDEARESKSSGYEWRIGRLRELGFEGRLRSLVNDPHIEVQGRARAALEQFDCNDVYPLDYDPSALLDYNTSLMARQAPRSPPVLLRVAESDSSSAGSST